ncbi:MAG: putative DNA binding domain-containing protein [Clostridiales bacterium]|nr:putative DNA binding domain-containing protein [Clostridiales bacterium]
MRSLNEHLIAEATEYEFKRDVNLDKPKNWLKSISAFANGIGGSIYFGVEDNGEPCGLTGTQTLANRISALVNGRIEPQVVFTLEPFMERGHEILRLEVRASKNTPIYCKAEGTREAYYRLGNESVPASPQILNELILKGQNQTFDAIETQYLLADYSFSLFESTYKQATKMRIERPKDFQSFGLLSNNGKLTLAGALFADISPVYQSRVFCTRWNGLDKTSGLGEALDDEEFSGNILWLLNDSEKFVRLNSKTKWYKNGHGHVDLPEYPIDAVHEALVNAIVHRDYSVIGSEIHIDMYDDRLEISSPGGMPGGKQIQNLEIDKIASARRNPIICDMFSRLQLMERRGSGLLKIVNKFPDDRQPQFYSDASVFIITLRNLNYGVEIERKNHATAQ